MTAQAAGDTGRRPRQTAAGLLARTPIRVKLITAVLALVAIALTVISFAGIGFLRSYLINQAAGQLADIASSQSLPEQIQHYSIAAHTSFNSRWQFPGAAALPSETSLIIGWMPDGGRLQWLFLEPTSLAESPFLPTSPLKPAPAVDPSASWIADPRGQTALLGAPQHGRYLLLAVPGEQPADAYNNVANGTIVIGLDVNGIYATIARLTGIDLALSGVLLIGIGVAGVALIRASLRPLTDIEKTAQAIASGELSRRVPERDARTEIGRLGRSLNAMLAQIETAFAARSASEAAARRSEDRMRQFIADASHELRTPLTAIRGFAEYYRQRGGVKLPAPALRLRPAPEQGALPAGGAEPGGENGSGQLAPADLDRIMRRVEQESSRMGILVEDLLLLARLDQQRPLNRDLVDLLTLAADAVHDARVVAPSRAVHLTVRGGNALLVLGDEVRLRQVIGNLMSNAMAHTPDGTPIDVVVRSGTLDEARDGGPFVTRAPGLPERVPAPAAWPALPGADPDSGDAAEGPPASDTVENKAAGAAGWTGPAGWAAGRGGPAGWRPGPPPPAAEPVHLSGPLPAPLFGSRAAAVLEVTDHGPGLTREQAEHAFERFYRADPARTSGGTGLGLAIVAALVAAHGGVVWVESRPGAGASFRIALPLAPEAVSDDDADPALTAAHRPAGQAQPGSG